MLAEPGIICYQHCRKDVKVFCFSLPKLCNYCQSNLNESELRMPPFRVPYPFRDASREPNSVVIRPTSGDFLNCYNNSSNLHIGVTDSIGLVYEYDSCGLMKTKGDSWSQCLAIKVLKLNTSTKCHWNETIMRTCNEQIWSSKRYSAENYNCYTFVLKFLQMLQIPELKQFVTNKTIFCEHFIVPQTRVAAKYISLYRQLGKEGIVAQ